jgi:hypothetical protein
LATLREVFAYVALLGEPVDIGLARTDAPAGGNLVAVASDSPTDLTAIQKALDARSTGWRTVTGRRLTTWTADAPVLTDDYAPVDQLLQPYATQHDR